MNISSHHGLGDIKIKAFSEFLPPIAGVPLESPPLGNALLRAARTRSRWERICCRTVSSLGTNGAGSGSSWDVEGADRLALPTRTCVADFCRRAYQRPDYMNGIKWVAAAIWNMRNRNRHSA